MLGEHRIRRRLRGAPLLRRFIRRTWRLALWRELRRPRRVRTGLRRHLRTRIGWKVGVPRCRWSLNLWSEFNFHTKLKHRVDFYRGPFPRMHFAGCDKAHQSENPKPPKAAGRYSLHANPFRVARHSYWTPSLRKAAQALPIIPYQVGFLMRRMGVYRDRTSPFRQDAFDVQKRKGRIFRFGHDICSNVTWVDVRRGLLGTLQ